MKVRVCRAVGGVHVISCVVGSSSFQCSDWTDKLRPVELFDHRWTALRLFFPVQIEWKKAFRFIFYESVIVISWNCPTYLGCDLVDVSHSLLTLWLLLCCCVGHVVLLSNPGQKTRQTAVDSWVLTELAESRIGKGEERAAFQETVHPQRGESS